MGEKWRANVAYGPAGTRVEYEGTVYELIQPHTSQIGWEPTLTPALWRVARNQDSGSSHHSSDHHHSSHSSEKKQEEHKHEHKHEHHDHHHHEEKPQQQQQQPQPQQQQQQPQQQQQQPQPAQFQQQQNVVAGGVPYTWVDVNNGNIPQNAFKFNTDIGKEFVIARGKVNDCWTPGYVDPAKGNGKGHIYIGYGGKEVVLEQFQVLTANDKNRLRWVGCSDPSNINGNPIQGGCEKDKTPLYVTKCMRGNTPYFGKTSPKSKCAYYGFNRNEEKVNNFEVLCFQ